MQFLEQYIARISEEEKQTEDDSKRLLLRLENLRSEKADAEKVLLNLQRRAGVIPPPPKISDQRELDPKGELFEHFAKQRGDQGFTIADIFKVFGEQNLAIGKNYPYFLVDTRYKSCLQKVGSTRNGKRYYWTENGTTSE